jgi:3'-phosphoadenosine 5'-phosphosulfate sulfotransferase (PAPS reductase)/FAD synthetase
MGAARVMVKNIISISGGKDSTATALLAIAMEADNLELVFADTGNEHVLTYDYVDYLQQKLDLPIRKVKADFTVQIERKKRKLEAGELVGWTDKAIAAALGYVSLEGAVSVESG